MKRLYRSTFDQVKLSEETAARMRERLAVASSPKEVLPMKKHLWRTIPVAAVLIAALVCTAFAYGDQILWQLQMLVGGTVTSGTDEEGNRFVHMTASGDSAPVEVKDGRIYFVRGDTREDITDQCSEERYFSYEETTEDGARQVLVIGGTPEQVGYVNFAWMPGGSFASSGEAEDAPWLRQAYADYGIEWNEALWDGSLEAEPVLPYEVRDGRVYFTLDGSDRDITDQCSGESWFTYETTGTDGSRQILLIGGAPDEVNYLEIVYSNGQDGAVSVSNPVGDYAGWMDRALEEYGLESLME